MKKRLLSLSIALCLALALFPAAFAAAEDDGAIFVHGQWIQLLDAAALPAAMSGNPAPASTLPNAGTVEDPYQIGSTADFIALQALCSNNITEKHAVLTADLDLSTLTVDEWSGYLTYFNGTLNGGGHTIRGIDTNRFLIYGWYKGTIQNLTLDLGGKAGSLVYSPVSASGVYTTTVMCNITVKSTNAAGAAVPVTLINDVQANYAPFLFASGPYFTMKNCTNYADIGGATYASAFYGYYPLPVANYPSDASVNITNCTNHGNLNLRCAGLVFGNPTYLNASRNITITGLKNYGEVRGTESAHYFSTDPFGEYYGATGFHQGEEAKITTADMTLHCTEPACPNTGSQGSLCVGESLAGFALSVNADKHFVITAPTSAAGIDHYVVTAYQPISIFDSSNVYQGTDRVYISETIAANASALTTLYLADFPLKDGTLPADAKAMDTAALDFSPYLCVQNAANANDSAYWINNSLSTPSGYRPYLNRDQTPGTVQWNVYVSAYTQNNALIDTAVVERPVIIGPFESAAKEHHFYLCALADGENSLKAGQSISATAPNTEITSFDELYQIFCYPAGHAKIDASYRGLVNAKTSFAMMIADKNAAKPLPDTVNAASKIEITGRSCRIGTAKVGKRLTLQLTKGASVADGNLLFRNAEWAAGSDSLLNKDQSLQVELGAPITVQAGGKLYFDTRDRAANDYPANDTLVAPRGESAIVIESGGEAHIAGYKLERAQGDTSTAPLITVKSGGSLTFEPGSSTLNYVENGGMPVYQHGSGHTLYERYAVNLSTPSAIVQVEAGGKATVRYGTLHTTSDAPAIAVAAGGTLEITDEATGAYAVSIASGSGSAVTLAAGAIVQRGGLTMTAGDAGASYLANNGDVILAAGSTVQQENAQPTPLPNGGTVKADGTVVPGVPATAITLDQASLTLYSNATPNTATLTATPEPAHTTDDVIWTSDNPAVATVVNGVVTAAGNGTATITATAGSVSATCTVTVRTYSSSSGGGSSTPSTPTVSEPDTSGGSTTVTAEVKSAVSGSTAKAEVNTATADKAVESAVNEAKKQGSAPVVKIDVDTPSRADSLAVTLPVKSLETLSGHADASLVITSDVGSAALDFAALSAVAEQADGKVTLSLVPVSPAELNPRQQNTVGDAPVYDISIVSGGAYISDFGGGSLSLTVPYELAEGQDPAGVVVYYLDENGNTHKCETTCNADAKTVTFRTSHLSKYVVAYEPVVWSNPFADVAEAAWYYDAAMYTARTGLMTGVSDTVFEPDGAVTRAQMWTVLARLAGQDVTGGEPWYALARTWAMAQGVSDGTDPDGAITREQLVSMLWRSEGSPASTGTLTAYTDADSVANYARTAMAWAVDKGIVSGTGNGVLSPQSCASRAQLAAILQRYMQ